MPTLPAGRLKAAKPAARSRGDKRREAFLKAAVEVFLEQGYEAASMAEIVARAGGSLTTLYTQFGDKQGLVVAVIRERTSLVSDLMLVGLSPDIPLHDGFVRIVEESVARLLEPDALELYRLVLSLSARFPDVGAAFLENGPQRLGEALAAYFQARVDAGEIELADPRLAAEQFIVLMRSVLVTRALLDPSYKPSPEDISASVQSAMDLFVNGVKKR